MEYHKHIFLNILLKDAKDANNLCALIFFNNNKITN